MSARSLGDLLVVNALGIARFGCLLVFIATLIGVPWRSATAADSLVVFAAASTKNVVDESLKRFRTRSGVDVVASYAASSVIARQVSRGAPADLILTANPQWMDHLREQQLVRVDTVVNVAGNRLALIAGADFVVESSLLPIRPDMPIVKALGKRGRVAIADPRHVPAGQYARAALESLGLWTEISSRLAPAGNVRLALTLVSRGESPLGIVYASDVLASVQFSNSGIKQLGLFAADSHPPVRYFAALANNSGHPSAADLLAFFVSSEGQDIFQRFGFRKATQ